MIKHGELRPTTHSAPPHTAMPADGMPRFVRVTGTLNEHFVEFEFSIGDPELCVELVMRFEQFQEFCERHQAIELSVEQCARLDYEKLKWRFGQAGITE